MQTLVPTQYAYNVYIFYISGLGTVQHDPEIVEKDRKNLYTSVHFNTNSPAGLMNKVQVTNRK
jgi:hypothetical protein